VVVNRCGAHGLAVACTLQGGGTRSSCSEADRFLAAWRPFSISAASRSSGSINFICQRTSPRSTDGRTRHRDPPALAGNVYGLLYRRKLYKWGISWRSCRFPLLNPIDKFRYARHVFMASKRRDGPRSEHRTVRDWIVAQAGERSGTCCGSAAFDLKFYRVADSVSALAGCAD